MPLLGNVVDSGYGMWEWFIFDTGLEIMGGTVSVDFNVAGSERFHFNGLDNTSTSADVRAMMGAPDEVFDGRYVYIFDHEGYVYWHTLGFLFDASGRILSMHYGWGY